MRSGRSEFKIDLFTMRCFNVYLNFQYPNSYREASVAEQSNMQCNGAEGSSSNSQPMTLTKLTRPIT